MKKFTESEILESKTPQEYIQRCLHTNISMGRKTRISTLWQQKTGYTVKDIKYARHRNPYWKDRKKEGWKERNIIRWKKHNYKETMKLIRKRRNKEDIKNFLELNKKDKTGKYINRDWQIAKKLKTTIPAIQGLRRNFNMIQKLGIKSKKEVLELMCRGEIFLRNDKNKFNKEGI